jgi:hypothetical protein
VIGSCLFCWYWWNCCLSLFKLSFIGIWYSQMCYFLHFFNKIPKNLCLGWISNFITTCIHKTWNICLYHYSVFNELLHFQPMILFWFTGCTGFLNYKLLKLFHMSYYTSVNLRRTSFDISVNVGRTSFDISVNVRRTSFL